MLMCHKTNNCACSQHRILDCLRKGQNKEAKSFLQKLENFEKLMDALGSTLLHFAVKYKNKEMIQYFIDAGCKVDAQDISGITPLMLAIKSEDAKIVVLLLKNNASIYHNYAKYEITETLVEDEANVKKLDEKNRSLLHVYTNYFEDFDEKSEILEFMLRNSKDLFISKNGALTPISSLLMFGKKRTVRTILLSVVDVDERLRNCKVPENLLSLLTWNSKYGVLELLDELGIQLDVNYCTSYGITALMHAAIMGRPKMIGFLLRHGADVNVINVISEYERSVLSYCRTKSYNQNDNAKVMELLLHHGADAQHPSCTDLFFRSDSSLPLKIFVAHLAMLGSLEPPTLTDLFRNKINSSSEEQNHFKMCTRQLKGMKSLKLNGTVTLFKLLTEDEDTLIVRARNQELISTFSTTMENLSDLEPYYFNTLKRRLSKLSDEAKLQETSLLAIETLTGLNSDVYRVIMYQIISHLDPQDMNNLNEIENDRARLS